MSTNPTPESPDLPDGMRLLSHEEMRAVGDAVRASARRTGVRGHLADEIAYDALAAAGVFNQPPEPSPDECTALYLPYDAQEFGADGLLGVWQQCGGEPGHDGDEHDNGEVIWHDGRPGAVPARPVAAA
ncbi:hypothetical protein [Streptomyces sp. NRRL F-525]|uniref:hypothetical protein n=1 Tax=Streptomyces sp. NRRL F-525 TaxID=1463861 RepID=UPI000A801DF0|nr:hypothetical protein [Streptomyces sp. NRRL F-525]